jgi:hypothetical protein
MYHAQPCHVAVILVGWSHERQSQVTAQQSFADSTPRSTGISRGVASNFQPTTELTLTNQDPVPHYDATLFIPTERSIVRSSVIQNVIGP